jgi:hypothetical protein
MFRILFAAVLVLTVAGCEVESDDHPDSGGTAGGACYYQYDEGMISGFGCLSPVDDRADCEDWVMDKTDGGATLIQWDFMVACADAGCDGTCGPDWWSRY